MPWCPDINGGGGAVTLSGDANGPSDNNTVDAIHSNGVQLPIGLIQEDDFLQVVSGEIVGTAIGNQNFSITAEFDFNDGTVDIGSSALPAGAVVKHTQVSVGTEFDNPLAEATVGWAASQSGIMGTTEIDLLTAGTYSSGDVVAGVGGQQLQIYVTAGGSIQGSGTVIVDYVVP